ncbi:hypothetical protein F4677DRAFT_408868 [Hypoxylon crocopeplum]|nr:hypothetical protein F4677DRAFT_408868 [Hypoxylon crocopeplum]
MCPHRKTVYQCNHSVVSRAPIQTCQAQRDYQSGRRSLPCYKVTTHGRSSIRVSILCPYCHDRKAKLEKSFDNVKSRIATLRGHLEETYGQCLSHLDEAGVELEKISSSPGTATDAELREGDRSDNARSTAVDKTEMRNSEREFMRKKRLEIDAHLMMFW